MTTAYINRIATATPPNDVHEAFVRYAQSLFVTDERRSSMLGRMIERSGIAHRYSCLEPADDFETGPALDIEGYFLRGQFPDTATRMRLFERHAPELATSTVEQLALGADRERISHLIITSCTGLSAPGLDIDVIERCGLRGSVERTMIGFMGCYAAINALKLARHIVRSDPAARVLVINLELCTLHFHETTDLAQVLCFLLFADGCAACLVSADPYGIAIDGFQAAILPNTRHLMAWNIREAGFDMVLSGLVPAAIYEALRFGTQQLFGPTPPASVELWAAHPGGRTILDAIERAFALKPAALAVSRDILRRYGNMSSAAVMFVLEVLMRSSRTGQRGCAMSFGPGLVAEIMMFRRAA